MFFFLLPLILGFALACASAFTTAYSRRWGERGGQLATSILRNVLGIPLWFVGYGMAWMTPAPLLLMPAVGMEVLGGLLVVLGTIPVLWGHLALRWRTHMPSVRDTLVRTGLYAHVRHPIYAGMVCIFVGFALLLPTWSVAIASIVGVAWAFVQARLEEIDLRQRLPEYEGYMREVAGFVPRLRTTRSSRSTHARAPARAADGRR